uniref:Uncharacterized protein n=1 Tax=Populus alba TaxID=43335 RepID=A0A4U5PSY0_POPAL|nr:hypothetical protein D5086_0000184170 [Populus alba]
MENGSTRYRAPHPQLVNVLKQRRSGYEPSDTVRLEGGTAASHPTSHKDTTQRAWGKEQENSHGHKEQKGGRSPSPLSRSMIRRQREREVSHTKAPSVGELNEIVANIKLSKGSMLNAPNFESTESIPPGDIFFSVDQTAMAMQKNAIVKDNNVTNVYPRPTMFPRMDSVLLQRNKANANINHNSRRTSTTTSGSRMTMTSASSASRRSSSKLTSDDSKMSEAGGRTSGSLKKFTANRKKKQSEVSHDSIPYILLKGQPGSGKKALALALIREIFGDACWNKTHDLRYFQVQEQRAAAQVAISIASSAHHVEISVNSEPNAKYALMGLVKEISNTYSINLEVNEANFKPDYKDDSDILETVKNSCKVLKVDAPVTHEIMEVLIQIARKEEFDLPMNFASKIAAKSKQNLRKAIMALEACKAHK